MAKKAIALILIIFMLLCTFETAFAATTDETETDTAEVATDDVTSSETAEELYEIKEGVRSTLQDYVDQYGSYVYGLAAYILNTIRIYSIPLCFIGIAVGAIDQYMIGIRRLDVRDRGFGLIITFVTILLICQTLPLIFAIIVNGWRG